MIPLISILLPAKNPGPFLRERLDSILAQSVTDWELIIADSHSTDGSREIFSELVRQDPRVSLYELPSGLYQAWNFAIRKARGKYVYIATADDTMRADALEKMSQALEAHPECGLCDSRLTLIDERSWFIEPAHNYTITEGAFAAHGLTKEFLKEHGVSMRDIAPEILKFVEDSDYLTYNGNSFDVKFIYKDLALFGYDFPIENKIFYDAFLLYKKYHPCTLSNVYKMYTGKELEGAHDAFADTKATIEVFKCIRAERMFEQPNEEHLTNGRI